MGTVLSALEYRLLVDHSPVMIWRSGLDAKCDYFNEPWLAFTGRTLEQEVGDGWAEGVHPDDFQRCVDYYLDHFHRRVAFEMEYRLRRHDGVYRWIFDRGVPFTNDAGEFAGFIGSCVDVENRRRAQQHERDQLADAQEFERWILSIVSHDIRNPLNTIDLSAQLLSDRDDAEIKQLARRISRGVDRISSIVGDLLDLSRERHRGGIPITPKPMDLSALARDVIEEIAVTTKGRSIAMSGDAAANGQWDSARLSQAISNLIANAIKHGAPGTPISVRVTSDIDHATVEVHNQGAIAPAVLPTLFEPFSQRTPQQHAKQDGLGLGLFIAKSIARAHRGELEVDSTPEAGTTFRLVLPRATP